MRRAQISLAIGILAVVAAILDFLVDLARHRPDRIPLVLAAVLAAITYTAWRQQRTRGAQSGDKS